MRLFNGLALAGLAGLASASHAEVYILSKESTASSSSSSSTPHVPRQVAKQIFAQRLGGEAHLSELHDAKDLEQALSHIAQFGRAPRPLFREAAAAPEIAPSQLLVVFEGITDDNAKKLKRQLKDQNAVPSFTIPDAPSHQANERLIDVDLNHFSKNCDIAAAINPYDSCWEASLAVKFDLKHVRENLLTNNCLALFVSLARADPVVHLLFPQNHDAIQTLVDNFHLLRQHIAASDLEATLLLLPESTRAGPDSHWATASSPAELRRRAESVLTVPQAKVVVAPGSGAVAGSGAADIASSPAIGSFAQDPSSAINLGCFSTFNSCVTATSNCTGHGVCVDKYAAASSDGQEGDRQCFVCACKSTKTHPDDTTGSEQHTHWGGAYCQKIDVSSPFWLLAGTSILLIGVVTGCIGLLFSVGEEKLPGVIGAGVSRSK